MFSSPLHEVEAGFCMVYNNIHTDEFSVYPSLHVEARFDVTNGASIHARMQESAAIVTTSISNDPIWNDLRICISTQCFILCSDVNPFSIEQLVKQHTLVAACTISAISFAPPPTLTLENAYLPSIALESP